MTQAIHAILAASAVAGAAAILAVLVNLARIPRLSREGRRTGAYPRVSVLVPARNEERGLEAGVGSFVALEYPDFEVIVVDDGSTDRTGEILAALARQSPRLRVIAGSDPPGGWLGKPHALSLASRAASGELLLFVDADVRYDPRALSEAVDLMEAENADLLALLPWIEARGFWENVLMPYLAVSLFFGPAFLANRDRPRWFAIGGGTLEMMRNLVADRITGSHVDWRQH